MKGAKAIEIGDRRFPSKKAAGDFIREILYRYPIGARISNADSRVLLDLLTLHREAEQKIGVGVEFFTVEQNMSTRGFWLTRTDGSRTDWSFLACLTPPTREAEAKAAFRTAIRDQIVEFRACIELGGLVCPITGEALTGHDQIHIDHEIPFETLLSRFLDEQSVQIDSIDVIPTRDGSTEHELRDDRIRSAWQRYHREHALLRAVSRRANLSVLRRRA